MADMKSPLLLAVKFGGERKTDSFSDAFGERKVIDLNDGSDHPDLFHGVKYAIVWKPDASLFARLPDLEIIFSAGAGVDHILQAKDVPDLPIVRFVDHTLTTRMSEWVCLQCLSHLRQVKRYDRDQSNSIWNERPQPEAKEITVGVMGLGVLGQDAIMKLKMLGFNVVGWSRTKKQIPGIMCFGQNELDAFLTQCHFVVNLLPLTPLTEGFFDRTLFSKLNAHEEIDTPVFINAGRGRSQNEQDIVSCLQDGTLGGVSLDVFESEPLSPDSALWSHPAAILTPHVAASSDATAISHHVNAQIERYEAGKPLEYLVDRKAGY
jgi:glyoxylate/hydroxypyruvate reductase A